jgi:hypothetical protein
MLDSTVSARLAAAAAVSETDGAILAGELATPAIATAKKSRSDLLRIVAVSVRAKAPKQECTIMAIQK